MHEGARFLLIPSTWRFGSYAGGVEKPQNMRIGELAGRLGINPRTIRYYERVEILPAPARTASGYRMYGDEDEQRLRFVKAAQRVGLTLDEIKDVMAFATVVRRRAPTSGSCWPSTSLMSTSVSASCAN